MKLNETIYVAVDAETGDIMGNHECLIMCSDRELVEEEMAFAEKGFSCKGKIVEARIVPT